MSFFSSPFPHRLLGESELHSSASQGAAVVSWLTAAPHSIFVSTRISDLGGVKLWWSVFPWRVGLCYQEPSGGISELLSLPSLSHSLKGIFPSHFLWESGGLLKEKVKKGWGLPSATRSPYSASFNLSKHHLSVPISLWLLQLLLQVSRSWLWSLYFPVSPNFRGTLCLVTSVLWQAKLLIFSCFTCSLVMTSKIFACLSWKQKSIHSLFWTQQPRKLLWFLRQARCSSASRLSSWSKSQNPPPDSQVPWIAHLCPFTDHFYSSFSSSSVCFTLVNTPATSLCRAFALTWNDCLPQTSTVPEQNSQVCHEALLDHLIYYDNPTVHSYNLISSPFSSFLYFHSTFLCVTYFIEYFSYFLCLLSVSATRWCAPGGQGFCLFYSLLYRSVM